MFNYIVVVYNLISYICKKIFNNHLNYLSNMEFYLTRTVCFDEETCIEAENLADLKAKLEDAELDWEVNFKDGAVWLEKMNVQDEDGNEFELDPYTAPDDVGGMNGCIIFNEKEFNKYAGFDD